jgi:uncharacterized membrane protein
VTGKNRPHASSNRALPGVAPANPELGLERIVFFSDAVMAIAMTLLTVDIKVPDIAAAVARSELPARLSELSPQIMSFVISFVVIGIYWISHHRYFSFIKRYDNRLMALNLLFLLFIAGLPFTASLLGHYPYVPLSVIIYAAEVTAIGLSMSALWWYASHSHRLVDEALDPRFIRLMTVRSFGGAVVFLLSIPVAFFSTNWAVVVWWTAPFIVAIAMRFVGRRRA